MSLRNYDSEVFKLVEEGHPDNPSDIGGTDSPNPARLRMAMDLRKCLTLIELAERANVAESTLRNWIYGRISRSQMRTTQSVAAALQFPVSFFMGSGPIPIVSSPSFRSASRDLEHERARFEAYAGLAGEFDRFLFDQKQRRSAGIAKIRKIGNEYHRPPDASAMAMRGAIGLRLDEPVAHVIALLEELDIVVAFGPADESGIDAFSAWLDNSQPVVLLSSRDRTWLRQRFDGAHELGHLVMHSDQGAINIRARESEAHQFAEGLLFPPTNANASRLTRAIKWDDSFESLLNIHSEWGISLEALLEIARRRSPGLSGLVASKRSEWRAATQEIDGKRREFPTRFSAAANELIARNGRPIESLTREIGLPEDVVRALMSQIPIAA